jgi:predicted PurR-regulated permease PerM
MQPYIPRFSEPVRVWVRFGILLVLLLLLCWIVYRLRAVFTPILLGAAIAYVLNPLVTAVERHLRLQRLMTVIVVFALAGTVLIVGGLMVYTQLVGQVQQLQENMPRYVEVLGRALDLYHAHFGPPPATVPATLATAPTTAGTELTTLPTTTAPVVSARDWWGTAEPLLKEYGATAGQRVLGYLQRAIGDVLNLLTLLVLVPLFTFYFLWRFNAVVTALRDHLPVAYRDPVVNVVRTIDSAVASFFRGRLIVCSIIGLFSALGWSLVGVPYSLPLGLLAGALNLVPFMSLLALPPALLLAYLNATAAGQPWVMPVTLAMGVYMAAQALESFLLSPLIESRTSGLHPLVIVVALLIGGEIAGLAGMLLAIPVASTLRTLASELLLPELRRLAGPPVAGGAEPQTPVRATAPPARE